MDALDRVKYVLAQLPREDQEELAQFLHDMLLTPEEAEAIIEGPGHVATVTSRAKGAGGGGTVTYRLETVKCGKKGCTKCPHGPYVYKYWREDGRLRKKYAGKPGKNSERAAQATLAPR